MKIMTRQMQMRYLGFFLSLFFLSAFLSADKVDSEINKVRNQKGKSIIRCSPDGKVPDTKTLSEAMQLLKPGMTLQLLPGRYNPQERFIFSQDNIIIEGDGSGGFVDYDLILYGKNCILRNINIRSCRGGEAIKIVDARAHGLAVTASRVRRGFSIVANCALNSLLIYPNLQDVVVRNCTIVNAHKVQEKRTIVQSPSYSSRFVGGYVYNLLSFGQMEKKGNVEFGDCVLYSEGNMFSGGDSKMLTLILSNNIIYFARSIVSTKDPKVLRKSMKTLKERYRVKLKGKNLLKKPEFIKEPTAKSYRAKDCFILKPESAELIKGVGCRMGAGNIPVWESAASK